MLQTKVLNQEFLVRHTQLFIQISILIKVIHLLLNSLMATRQVETLMVINSLKLLPISLGAIQLSLRVKFKVAHTLFLLTSQHSNIMVTYITLLLAMVNRMVMG